MVGAKKAVLLQSQNGREGARQGARNWGGNDLWNKGTKVADKYEKVLVPRVRKNITVN